LIGTMYVVYTLYKNIQIYESPVDHKKYLLLINDDK
jgi:hypothetical protein